MPGATLLRKLKCKNIDLPDPGKVIAAGGTLKQNIRIALKLVKLNSQGSVVKKSEECDINNIITLTQALRTCCSH